MVPPRQRFDHGEHRPSTVLELLFDLATVIAIATAAAGLHDGLVEGQIVHGLLSFIMALFMIWWSWMNYTWFASAYDDRSPFFRAMTFIVIFGALTLAAGIPAVYAAKPIITCLLGFVIMSGVPSPGCGCGRSTRMRLSGSLREATLAGFY